MNSQEIECLLDEHSSAKKKMILGIVFSGVATLFFYICYMSYCITYHFNIAIFLLSLIFFGVGTPFLIIGVIKTISTNVAISQASKARRVDNLETVPQQAVPQAQYIPPVQEVSPIQEVSPTQEVSPIQEVSPTQEVPPVQNATNYQNVEFNVTPFLNWEKYEPLECGVSYNADKDYKFHRADGFVGSLPQKFVDRTFPRCPICCSNTPDWTIAQHNQMSWKGNLYLFKCSDCGSIISMTMPDVVTLGNGAGGVVRNPNVGLTNLMVKASSGKEAGAVYAVIESVGNSGVSRECEGKEFKLEDLQDMFLRR